MDKPPERIEWGKCKGNYRSFKIITKYEEKEFIITKSGRLLRSSDGYQYKGYSPHKNYHSVVLNLKYKESRIFKRYYIHRLVAMAFIENPKNLPEVNHINGIKSDNNFKNLEWSDRKQNVRHAIKNNLTKNRSFNYSQYTCIIADHFCRGIQIKDIAKSYNVKPSTVSLILNGNSYKDFYDILVEQKNFCESSRRKLIEVHNNSNSKLKDS